MNDLYSDKDVCVCCGVYMAEGTGMVCKQCQGVAKNITIYEGDKNGKDEKRKESYRRNKRN